MDTFEKQYLEAAGLTNVLHQRQHWPVGHGFFHTSKVTISDSCYHYVYDCGSMWRPGMRWPPKVFDSIERYDVLRGDGGCSRKINVLAISHFHFDHICGVKALFRRFTVERLVLPYLNRDLQIVLLTRLAAEGIEAWTDYHGLIYDPNAWVREIGGQGEPTHVIQVDDQEGETTQAPLPGEIDDGARFPRPGIANHGSFAGYCWNGTPLWLFRFYVQKDLATAGKVVGALKRHFKTDEAGLLAILTNAGQIRAHWKEIADVYKASIPTSRQNVISLCMYSGMSSNRLIGLVREREDHGIGAPIIPTLLRRIRLCISDWASRMRWCRGKYPWFAFDCMARPMSFGWVGTGDADLRSPGLFENFLRHYFPYLCYADTISIPHHGSIHNFDFRLGCFGSTYVITGPSNNSPAHHPSDIVIEALKYRRSRIRVITENRASRLDQEITAVAH